MAIIFVGLVDDELIKPSLNKTSYKKLREQIVEILFPKYELRLFAAQIERVRQRDFVKIRSYYLEIERLTSILTNVQTLTLKEHNRRVLEAFHRGLGEHTSLELLKQGLDTENIDSVLKLS
ncbi:hypothetical protein NGRA_2651 [Nosema granulosis]|uniref:Retrotransposon gag domain-containing protein n=1 Tax=Nosema granulosis TaxID=83296 RepID=A0A9P6KY85_9MICR|nr:hypothetical protein NGRA_2651 [Nosema granulosis]